MLSGEYFWTNHREPMNGVGGVAACHGNDCCLIVTSFSYSRVCNMSEMFVIFRTPFSGGHRLSQAPHSLKGQFWLGTPGARRHSRYLILSTCSSWLRLSISWLGQHCGSSLLFFYHVIIMYRTHAHEADGFILLVQSCARLFNLCVVVPLAVNSLLIIENLMKCIRITKCSS